jgi:hypothetical protein
LASVLVAVTRRVDPNGFGLDLYTKCGGGYHGYSGDQSVQAVLGKNGVVVGGVMRGDVIRHYRSNIISDFRGTQYIIGGKFIGDDMVIDHIRKIDHAALSGHAQWQG